MIPKKSQRTVKAYNELQWIYIISFCVFQLILLPCYSCPEDGDTHYGISYTACHNISKERGISMATTTICFALQITENLLADFEK